MCLHDTTPQARTTPIQSTRPPLLTAPSSCLTPQVAPRDLYSQLPSDAASLQLQLPTVISHLQDYLIKVAAQLERLHTQVARAKEACVRSRPGAASKFEQVGRGGDQWHGCLRAGQRVYVCMRCVQHGAAWRSC